MKKYIFIFVIFATVFGREFVMAQNPKVITNGAIYDGVLIKKDKEWNAKGWIPDILTEYSVVVQYKENQAENPIDSLIDTAYMEGTDTTRIPDKKFTRKELCFGLQDNELDLALTVILLIIICLLFVIFVRLTRLNCRVKDIKYYSPQAETKTASINVEKISQAVLSNIKSFDLIQRISNEDIYNVLNRSDVQLYIQNIIVGKVEEYLCNKNKQASGDSGQLSIQPSHIPQPELRTSAVEYRAENNCFVISENSTKIFEIYSANGEYYYTLVVDPTIRRELLGVITAFSKCIEIRQDTAMPSIVEPIRDGRLIKDGEMYIVDTNYMLQVSLK